MAAVLESNRAKVVAIEEAQRPGLIDSELSAVEALGLVLHLALMCVVSLPEHRAVVGPIDAVRKRQVVVDAVRRRQVVVGAVARLVR